MILSQDIANNNDGIEIQYFCNVLYITRQFMVTHNICVTEEEKNISEKDKEQ